MREFEYIIDEALRAGLSPFDINSFNIPVLSACLGFRVGKGQLELFYTKDNPLPVTIDMFEPRPTVEGPDPGV